MGRDKQPKAATPAAPAPAPAPDAKKSRGHRQRGAGTVIKAPPPRVTADGIVLAPHMRMPSVLLQEYCQREKREKPIYRREAKFGDDPNLYKFTVVLKDGKNAKKDLHFCPSEHVESEFAARDFAALLALHHLQPTLPLERKIPEPFATTWVNLGKKSGSEITPAEEKPSMVALTQSSAGQTAPSLAPASKTSLKPLLNLTSTTPLSTYEREQAFLAKRKAKGISPYELANKPTNVYMSPKIRKIIENALGLAQNTTMVAADDTITQTSIVSDCTEQLNMASEGNFSNKTALNDAVQILLSYEFPLYNIHEALATLCEDCADEILGMEVQDDVVAYLVQSAMAILCLNVEESALPKNDHRNTGISIIPKKDAAKRNAEVSGEASELMCCGWSERTAAFVIELAKLYINEHDECLQSLVDVAFYLLHAACVAYATDADINVDALTAIQTEGDINLSDALVEELDMLQAIYADQCSYTNDNGKLVVNISLTRAGVPHCLILSIHSICNYPLDICSIRLEGSAASDGVYGKLYRKCAEFAAQEMGYLFQLADYAEDVIAEATENVNIAPFLLQLPFAPQEQASSSDSLEIANTKIHTVSSKKNDPKRINAFWSTPLAQYPQYTTNKTLLSFRNNLPAASHKDEFLRNMEQHLVVIVTGDTGSGKTTQMPQYLQEYSGTNNCRGRIVVCQPRRLAAITVAERVADEQGHSVGKTVGYSVRGQAKYGYDTALLFCTYGILLRHLQNDPLLSSVHERGAESDFTLALLLEAVAKRHQQCQTSSSAAPLKLVMMSATIQTEKFANYVFKQLSSMLHSTAIVRAPIVSVAGRTFPVTEYYLDDISEHLKPSKARKQNKSNDINYDAIVQLVAMLSNSSSDGILASATGAILIFMPGVAEIQKLITMLQSVVSDALLLPLHGALSPKEQQRAFQASRKLKIVVSTNIAEASVTIADVTVVVDSCRVKEMRNNNQMSSLTLQVASKDSCRQRMGRAGRVSAGRCFRMVTRDEYEALPQSTMPEILRTPLDRLLLMLHCLPISDPVALLQRCPDAPSQEAISTSLRSLTALQALRQQDTLTIAPLGRHLIHLPCDPTIGKLLIYGAMLGVVEEAAAIAACLVSRDPFWSSPDEAKRIAVRESKARLMQSCGSKSDFILYAELIHQYATTTAGMSSKRSFCSSNALVYERVEDIVALQEEFLGGLLDIGFISHRPHIKSASAPVTKLERKMKNNVVIAAVSAGLYPNVAKILRPSTKYEDTVAGAFEKSAEVKDLRFFVCADRFQAPPRPEGKNKNTCTIGLERVALHPSSNLFGEAQYASNFLVYAERTQSAHQVASHMSYLRTVSEVSPYPLLLFGGQLSSNYVGGEVCIDNWIRFSSPARIVALVNAIREALDVLLTEKIANPGIDVEQSAVMKAVNMLLAYDGVLL